MREATEVGTTTKQDTSKPWKKNCSDYKQTTKQDNKEINKQATKARLLRILHIFHPLGIKLHHLCKYREQSNILHTPPSKLATRANKRGSKTIP